MKFAFRADASIDIGTGHVMRCLTLADRLREEGAATRFLCCPLNGHLGELITARGHSLAWLPSRENLAQDAEDCLDALADEARWDWLVVDHYDLDGAWEHVMRCVANKIMVIDDLADRSHDCDLLLDQNLQGPGRYMGLIPESCQTLIGPKYALLRPQFAAARQNLRQRDGRVSRLLVFFGGSDAGGETLKALSSIQMLGRPDLSVDVVVGATNPHRAAIESACRSMPNTTLYCQVDDMATLMATVDLFVGAGGSSSWERCCLGLPAVILSCADNQVDTSSNLAVYGAQLYVGPASALEEAFLARVLDTVASLSELRMHLAKRGMELVDGCGVTRVVGVLQSGGNSDAST